jgi:hypothetical protein
MFLILSVALLAPAAAQAQGAKPVRNVPKLLLTLTDGAVNNKTVSPTITTTFVPPKGTTAAAACKGAVLVKAPIGKQTVKKKKLTIYAKKSASVKNVAGLCTSAATVKLPVTLKDKDVNFKAVFTGNSAVRGFAKSSKLKTSVTAAPAVPTAPAPAIYAGVWVAQLIIGGPDPDPRWQFEIKPDGSVSGITMTGIYTVTCQGGYADTFAYASHPTPFSFVGSNATTHFHDAVTGFTGTNYDVNTRFTFALYAKRNGFGTIAVSASISSPKPGGNSTKPQCSFGPRDIMLTRISPE